VSLRCKIWFLRRIQSQIFVSDGFDCSKISILDPIAVARASGQPPVADNLRLQTDDNPLSASTQLERKRPFDSEGDSQAQINQPPKKKARMIAVSKDRGQETTIQNAEKGGGNPDLPPRVCFSKASLPSGKVSKAIKTFESLIVYPKTISPPLTPRKEKDVAIS